MENENDVKAIAKKLFAAYDAHDVEGMLALCADNAQTCVKVIVSPAQPLPAGS